MIINAASSPSTLARCNNPTQDITFQHILKGQSAFYNQPDYLEATKRDFSHNARLPASYVWRSDNKILKIARCIFSLFFLPILLPYRILQAWAGGVALLPASIPDSLGFAKNHADVARSKIALDGEWKYKRLVIKADFFDIDAVIMGKVSTLGKRRWVLASNGNAEFYENKLLHDHAFKRILSGLDGNAIVFNYPGVGSSEGLPNRELMVKSYRAMLAFLEDGKNGVGAKEIIGYGHSIGAGIQGDALKTHVLKNDIKYVFVKSRTFSDMSTVVTILTNRILGFLVRILDWNIDPVQSSRKLKAAEIILQTADVGKYEEMCNSSKIISDGVIPAMASLAKALLDNPNYDKRNKIFIGLPEKHNDSIKNTSFLVQKIEKMLYRT